MDMGVACSPLEVEAPELDPAYPLWVGNLEQLMYQKSFSEMKIMPSPPPPLSNRL